MSEPIEDFVDKLNIYALCEALIMFNSALDCGKASGITLEEVQAHIKIGDLIQYLQERFGVSYGLKLRDAGLIGIYGQHFAG
jgi:hypothetical protein